MKRRNSEGKETTQNMHFTNTSENRISEEKNKKIRKTTGNITKSNVEN